MRLQEDVNWIRKVIQPNVFPGNSSWRYVDCTSSLCGNIHDGVKPKLSSAVCADIGEDVGIYRYKGNFFPSAIIIRGLIPLTSSIPKDDFRQLRIKQINLYVVTWGGYRSYGGNRVGDGSDDGAGECKKECCKY